MSSLELTVIASTVVLLWLLLKIGATIGDGIKVLEECAKTLDKIHARLETK